jgi:hypothetical protein
MNLNFSSECAKTQSFKDAPSRLNAPTKTAARTLMQPEEMFAFLVGGSMSSKLFSETVMPPGQDDEGGPRFSCNFCFFVATTRTNVIQHVNLSHPEVVKRTASQCPYCPLTYSTVGSLKVHISRKHRELHKEQTQRKRFGQM